jgi:hypothetical protein
MPTVSGPQHRLMEGIAHGSIPPGRGKPSLAVAKEFAAADAQRAHERTASALYKGGDHTSKGK